MKYVLALIIIGMNGTIKAMVAERGDLIYSYNKLNTHFNNLKEGSKAEYIKKQHEKMKSNKLGSFLQKSLLLSLEIKRLNFEEDINNCKIILGDIHYDSVNDSQELRTLDECTNMEKEDLIKQKKDLKQQIYAIYTIEKKIAQTAQNARNIAYKLLEEQIRKSEDQLRKIERTIQHTAHTSRMIALELKLNADRKREKLENLDPSIINQRIEESTEKLQEFHGKNKKNNQSKTSYSTPKKIPLISPSPILTTPKTIHPPILLSQPKPPPQHIFVRMRSYPHAQSAKIVTLTACLNEPSIRYDKHLAKNNTDVILLNFWNQFL